MLKIEKNISIPEPQNKRNNTRRESEISIIYKMVDEMEISDSTVIETNNWKKFYASLYKIPKRMGKKGMFKYQKLTENTYRIWRVL